MNASNPHGRCSMLSRSGWPALFALLFAFVLGVAHLHWIGGFRIASPSLPVWHNTSGDLAQASVGAEAFLRDRAWHFPLAATTLLLSDGEPLSIVYTDSAPWVAVAAKAAGLDETGINAVGLTVCLSVVLQSVGVAALLLAAGVRRVEVLALGVALGSLFPAWYMRVPGHVALSSHWLVLLALALAVHAVRARVSPAVVAGLCALGALAIGIHAYLFVMVAAVAVGGLMADLTRRGGGWRALPRTAATVAAFLAASAASAWLLGYGAGGGGVGGFGRYSMNLLSPVVPQVSGVAALLTGDPRPILDATGGQYEGYNYLGLGILLVLALAVLALASTRSDSRRAPPRAGVPRVGLPRAGIPLLLAFVALTALALSDRIFVGHVQVLDIESPGRALLQDLRASGRLFWPVAYALLALALAGLDKAPRRGAVAFALALAVGLQAMDTSIFRGLVERAFAAPPVAPDPALDPWRPGGPWAGRDVRLLPRYLCAASDDMAVTRELSLVVIRAGGRVEGAPAVRTRSGACADDRFAAVSPDRFAGERVDVLYGRSFPPEILALAARTRPCAPFALGAVCGAGVARTPGVQDPAAPDRLRDGERVDLTAAGDGRRVVGVGRGSGWFDPEAFGTWTEGKRALLALPLAPGDPAGGAKVTIEARAYAPAPRSGQEVVVSVAGHPVARWWVTREFGRFEADVPGALRTGDTVLLDLAIPGAISPHEAEGSPDRRTLGIAVRSLSVQGVAP